ncbi:hypothetical protein JHK87_001584 [Glycine soja]|nr:hypothetical protein JHK87_001584 [Glycine soja]
MWEFSVGLYMINIWSDSLLYAAIYGTIESASTALFDPIIGRWVDKLSYVKNTLLAGFEVVVGDTKSLFCYCRGHCNCLLVNSVFEVYKFPSFHIAGVDHQHLWWHWCTFNSCRCNLDSKRMVNPPELLTKMNSVTRRIDLTCKLLAPVVTGFIISFVSLKASAITLALWNTVSVWVEYWLFTSVYKGIPALGLSSQRRMERPSQSDQQRNNQTLEEDSLLSGTDGGSELADRKCSKKLFEKISEILVCFGTLMIATLEWEGIPACYWNSKRNKCWN